MHRIPRIEMKAERACWEETNDDRKKEAAEAAEGCEGR